MDTRLARRWGILPIILVTCLLLALLLIGILPVQALTAPAAAGDWLHFGFDTAYTANNPFETTISLDNIDQLSRRWGVGCDDGYFSVIWRSPAVRDGVLYTSGAGTRLTAYNAHTGQLQWQFGSNNVGWAPQPIVSEDGIVIYPFDADPTSLFAVNGQTGAEIWEAPVTFDLGFSGAAELVPTIDETNDLIYLVEEHFQEGGKLWALNLADGEVAWWMGEPLQEAAFVGSYPILSDGKIYAAADVPMEPYPYHGEHMLRIDPITQTIELTYERPTPENYWSLDRYTLCGSKLVVGFNYMYDDVKPLVAYDIDSPTIAWQLPFSEITGEIACDANAGVIYVPTDPYLYALDVTDGSEVWKHLGYGSIYNPSIANGIVYYLSDTNMYALDQTNGDQLFHFPLGYEADETTQVAIADGMLYFSGNGGDCDLYALSLLGQRQFLPLVARK